MEGKEDFKPATPQWIYPIIPWIKKTTPLPQHLPFAPFFREGFPFPASTPFGIVAKTNLFLVDPKCVFLNHGSYGAALRVTLEGQDFYRYILENQPVKFMGSYVLPLLVHAVKELAHYVNAENEDIVFVPNATGAINAVTRSLTHLLTAQDVLLGMDIGYSAVHNTLGFVCSQSGAKLVRFEVPYPWDEKQLLKNLHDTLQLYGSKVKVVVLDHITSMPCFLFPVKKMIEVIRSINEKIIIIVDGAHAVGNIPLNLKELGADVYTSNCHKWLCTPKGCAFLWVRKELQPLIRPNVISHGYSVGFGPEFYWSATSDYTSYLTVPIAIKAFRLLGFERVREYNKKLTWEGANLLARGWGTKVISTEETSTTMADVEIPKGRFKNSDFNALHDILEGQYKIEVPVQTYRGMLYCRVSSHIHTRLEDYEKLLSAVLEIQTASKSRL